MERSRAVEIALEMLPGYTGDDVLDFLDLIERTNVQTYAQDEELALREDLLYYLNTRKSSGY